MKTWMKLLGIVVLLFIGLGVVVQPKVVEAGSWQCSGCNCTKTLDVRCNWNICTCIYRNDPHWNWYPYRPCTRYYQWQNVCNGTSGAAWTNYCRQGCNFSASLPGDKYVLQFADPLCTVKEWLNI